MGVKGSYVSDILYQSVGLISLLIAQDETRTINDIKLILQETAEDQIGSIEEDSQGWDMYYGFGRINAYEALSYEINGDLNQDGGLNILDIIILMNMILDMNYSNIADMNQDGILNIQDIILILDIILGN